MGNDKITVDLVIDDSKAEKDLKGIEQDAAKSGRKSGRKFASGFSSSLKAGMSTFRSSIKDITSSIFNLRTALLGAGLFLFYRRAVEESAKLQNALLGLKAVAAATGVDMKRLEGDVKSLASDGLIPVANITASLKNLLSKGFTADQALKTFKSLRDAAAFNRQGQLEMGEAIERATQGLKNELSTLVDNAGITKNLSIMYKEYAASIGKTVGKLSEAEKVQAQYTGIQKEGAIFQGNYNLSLQTYAGTVAKVTGNLRFLMVAIGEMTTKSKVSIALLDFMAVEIQKLTAITVGFRKDSGTMFDTLIISAIDFGIALNDYVIFPMTVIGRVVSAGFSVVRTGVQAVITAVAVATDLIVSGAANAITKVMSFVPDSLIPEGFASSLESAKQVTSDFANSTKEVLSEMSLSSSESLDGLFDETALYNKTDAWLNRLREVAVSSKGAAEEIRIGVTSSIKKMEEDATKTFSKIEFNAQNTLAAGITKGVQSITTALIEGENAFDAFGGAILGIIGDLATQLGGFFIAYGIGKMVLDTFASGAAAIAAGAGLVALGTLMSSMSGASSAAHTAGGTSSPPPFADYETTEAPEIQEQKASVTLNIEGNYFDSEESNLKIVEMLNKAVDQNDVQIRQGAFA